MMVYRVIVLSLLGWCIYISAEICGNQCVHWSKTFISSGVNQLIVGTPEPSISVAGCSILCSKSCVYESFYYSSALQQCYCNKQLDGAMTPTTVDTGLIYGIRDKNQTLQSQPKDCLCLYQQGLCTDGVYKIYPGGGGPVEAWCDMTGGGWTVIQRRQDGSENFNRTWGEYVNGFGNKLGEYWLGLETMRIITSEASTLRIELETFGDVTPISAFAEYSSFAIGSSTSNYQLTVGGYSGSCGDSLTTWHNGRAFTTRDRDNDLAVENCAVRYKGAWWYSDCHQSNLNGRYFAGNPAVYGEGIHWNSCWGYYYSVNISVMKIRRNM